MGVVPVNVEAVVVAACTICGDGVVLSQSIEHVICVFLFIILVPKLPTVNMHTILQVSCVRVQVYS